MHTKCFSSCGHGLSSGEGKCGYFGVCTFIWCGGGRMLCTCLYNHYSMCPWRGGLVWEVILICPLIPLIRHTQRYTSQLQTPLTHDTHGSMTPLVLDQGASNCLDPGPSGAEKGMSRKEKNEHPTAEPVLPDPPLRNL
jgi:hypothetical protein